MNWYRIFGVIALLWGAGIVISFLLRGDAAGSGAYASGQYIGLVFGLVLLIAGLYAAITGGRKD
jgi:hypothetical protein